MSHPFGRCKGYFVHCVAAVTFTVVVSPCGDEKGVAVVARGIMIDTGE